MYTLYGRNFKKFLKRKLCQYILSGIKLGWLHLKSPIYNLKFDPKYLFRLKFPKIVYC